MKKVVMLADYHHEIPPIKGAAVETWMNEVSKKIISYEMHIISISHPFLPLKEFKDGIYYHRIFFSKVYKRIFQKILGWDVLSYQKRVINIIKEINPDIVHIHNFRKSEEIVRESKKFNKNIQIILHMHNENEYFKKHKYPKIDVFVACSNHLMNFYEKIIDSNIKKVIYNGVDYNKFNLDEDTKKSINLSMKINNNEINICYFGRISPEKGVDKFIELAILLKNEKKYNFFAFGEISRKGDRKKYYDNLLNIIKKENLNLKINNYITSSKMYLAYQYADIVIVPSKFEEPFGMVALEALAAGKIVIAVRKGGMIEFLNDKNSYIINDYNNFSVKAQELIQNIDLNNKSIINNAKITAHKFDWINIAIKTERLYNEISN